MTMPYNPNRHYDELTADALAQRYKFVGKVAPADKVRAVQILYERGYNASQIAMRLNTTDRNVLRMRRTEVSPMPEFPDDWSEDDEALELLKGAAAQ